MEFIHEIGSWDDEILAAQKKIGSRFYFQTARAQRINNILKVMSKFMFKPARRLLSSFIPYMSATLNTLFGIVLVNLSKDFLNVLYDSELRISKLNLFHSLIVQKKNELAKYSDLQKICLVLLLFRVRQSRSPGKIYLQRQPGDLSLTIL